MREIYGQIAERLTQGRRFVVATLVGTTSGSPAPVGTSLIVDPDGSFQGNIGAACHEAALIERATTFPLDGPAVVETYRLEDELLDGSVCGAALDVVLWRPNRSFEPVARAIADGTQPESFAIEALDDRGAIRNFVLAFEARQELVLVGGTYLAAHISRLARSLDFRVTLLDPRAPFATAARHPDADRILVEWPDRVLDTLLHERAALVVLAHDVKIDVPALRAGLASRAFYIGALGSRRAQHVRERMLRDAGCSQNDLARIHGPAGLNLGGDLPGQTALSIFAEILAARHDASGEPLMSTDGPIHKTLASTRI